MAINCYSLDGTTLFSKGDSNKLRCNAKNEITLICAKFGATNSLRSILLKLQAIKQSGPVFLCTTLYLFSCYAIHTGAKELNL